MMGYDVMACAGLFCSSRTTSATRRQASKGGRGGWDGMGWDGDVGAAANIK